MTTSPHKPSPPSNIYSSTRDEERKAVACIAWVGISDGTGANVWAEETLQRAISQILKVSRPEQPPSVPPSPASNPPTLPPSRSALPSSLQCSTPRLPRTCTQPHPPGPRRTTWRVSSLLSVPGDTDALGWNSPEVFRAAFGEFDAAYAPACAPGGGSWADADGGEAVWVGCRTQSHAAHDVDALGNRYYVTTLQDVVKSYHRLLACRFEEFFARWCFPWSRPILVVLVPMPISTFFSTAFLSGAFSGILAYSIIQMDGVGKRPGWAWIFILEGLFIVVFGLTAFYTLPRSPAHARFLNEKEVFVITQLKESGATGRDNEADAFSWRKVKQVFLLPQVWMLAVIFFLDDIFVYGLAYFTPSIVAGLGYTNAHAQLFSVPPFAVAFVVTMIGAYVSDRFGARGYVSMFAGILATIGFAMYLGAYSATPAFSIWSANNAAPYTCRAAAIAIGFIVTNTGGVLATWLLGTLSPSFIFLAKLGHQLIGVCELGQVRSHRRG
ncbi:hypothetical protein DXG01_003982 [Tephrocybe rancida]|nr:hypothetical protein DXG01_003982 [Tephrocybe rancida]